MNQPSDEMFGKLVCELVEKVSDFFIEIESAKVFLKKNIYSLEKKPLFFKSHELKPPLCIYDESDNSLSLFNEVDFLSDIGAFEELTNFFLFTLYLYTLEGFFKKIVKSLPNLLSIQPFVWYSFDFKGKKYESKELFFLAESSKKISILMKQNTFFYLLNSSMYSFLAEKSNLFYMGDIFFKLHLEVEGSFSFRLLWLNLLENLWNLNSFFLPFFLEKSFNCFNEFFFFWILQLSLSTQIILLLALYLLIFLVVMLLLKRRKIFFFQRRLILTRKKRFFWQYLSMEMMGIFWVF